MSNNRPLKSFIRYDGSGRAVSSSLIWRKNKPKVGNWKEVQGYECCDTTGCNLPPVTLTASGFTADTGCTPAILFYCNEDQLITAASYNFACIAIPAPINMIAFYNQIVVPCFSWMGTWSIDGEVVTLEMNGNLANLMCPDGELTMIATTGCPA
jgi:hypothetical protein